MKPDVNAANLARREMFPLRGGFFFWGSTSKGEMGELEMQPKTQTDLADMFGYLDRLRESGVTNMFGAGQYVAEAFDLDRREAKDVLVAWMKSFDRNQPAAIRAADWLGGVRADMVSARSFIEGRS